MEEKGLFSDCHDCPVKVWWMAHQPLLSKLQNFCFPTDHCIPGPATSQWGLFVDCQITHLLNKNVLRALRLHAQGLGKKGRPLSMLLMWEPGGNRLHVSVYKYENRPREVQGNTLSYWGASEDWHFSSQTACSPFGVLKESPYNQVKKEWVSSHRSSIWK